MMGIYNKSTRAILTLLDVGKDKISEPWVRTCGPNLANLAHYPKAGQTDVF